MNTRAIAARSFPFFLIAIALSLFGLYYISYQPVVVPFAEAPEPAIRHANSASPVHISIPSLGVQADVQPGYIESDTWTIASRKANHLAASANPGEQGNIIIYAHDTRPLFGKLVRITQGDVIAVKDADGKEHHYRVREKHTVTADDLTFVQPESTEMLTVYTCVGLLNSKRLIVRAKPI